MQQIDNQWHKSVDEAVKRAAKELADEIDFSVLASLYLETGWVEVDFPPHQPEQRAHEIKQWLEQNCSGHRTSRGRRFLFQNEQDAMWFKLRWLS